MTAAEREDDVLVGGRYDGYRFRGKDGWTPDSTIGVLYLSRAKDRDEAERLARDGFTTAGGEMTYCAKATHDPFDHRYVDCEVYVRCRDGRYRIASLARAIA